LTLLPFHPTLPRILRKEPAIKNEIADAAVSDAEFERLLASAFRDKRTGGGEGIIRPDTERETKSKSHSRNTEKETQHEDDP
jgi:hypothetical protein